MGYPDYRRDLLAANYDPNRILDRYYHSGEPVAFSGADPDAAPNFKRDVIRQIQSVLEIECHPMEIVICGSGHLGFSPVPQKLGKPFDCTTSDIDIAVVSPEFFDDWWKELQSSNIVPALRTRIAEELFWGFINPDTVRGVSEQGQKWWDVFGSIATDRAHGVRGRLYKNFWSMQNYHKLAIQNAHDMLSGVRS